jgi:hypothetical protein
MRVTKSKKIKCGPFDHTAVMRRDGRVDQITARVIEGWGVKKSQTRVLEKNQGYPVDPAKLIQLAAIDPDA